MFPKVLNFRKKILCFPFIIFLGIQFVISGVIINGIQLVLYIVLYNKNRNLYRKINYYLIYAISSHLVTMGQWWSWTRLRRWGKKEDICKLKEEKIILIPNHTYDTDWLTALLYFEDLGMLGNIKIVTKRSVGNIPIFGWSWALSDAVFVDRNWAKDKETLHDNLNNLASYEGPIIFALPCEGTRFTPEKHKVSMEFAKSRGLPLLEYHLLPRTRGFNYTVKHLKSKFSSVYMLQLAFLNGPVTPSFLNMLLGHNFVVDVYVKRIPIDEIPTDSDEATSKWLYKLYQVKDELMKNYCKTQKFPDTCIYVKPRIYPLLNVLFFTFSIGIPFIYYFTSLFLVGSTLTKSIILGIMISLFTLVYFMAKESTISTSSSYGTSK